LRRAAVPRTDGAVVRSHRRDRKGHLARRGAPKTGWRSAQPQSAEPRSGALFDDFAAEVSRVLRSRPTICRQGSFPGEARRSLPRQPASDTRKVGDQSCTSSSSCPRHLGVVLLHRKVTGAVGVRPDVYFEEARPAVPDFGGLCSSRPVVRREANPARCFPRDCRRARDPLEPGRWLPAWRGPHAMNASRPSDM